MIHPKFTFGLLLAFMIYASSANAQELTGKELVKSDDVSSLVESGIGLLFGASNLEGDVKKAVVTADTHNKLSVKVNFDGFSNAWLKGSFVNAEKARINDIVSTPIQLTTGSSEVDLSFSLKEKPQSDNIHSVLLKLMICKREGDATGKVIVFHLDKEWKTSGLSSEEATYDFIQEGVVINITPVAIGSATEIKDEKPDLPTPKKTSKVVVNKTMYKSNIVRKPMTFRIVNVQKSAVTKQSNTDKSKNFGMVYRDKKPPVKNTDKPKMVTMAIYTPVDPPLQLDEEQIDKGALGPGNSAISLWDEIMSDVNFDFGNNSITNINTDIFPDKNEQSGYYYYFPASYNLRWDKDEFYNLKILYGSASETESGQVNMFVQLTPAIGTKEKAMVKELVKEYANANKLPFEKLLPVPLASIPEVDLSGQLSSLYNIPVDKVSATVTGIFDPIDIAWPMNTKNADDLMVGLKEVDLNGSLKLVPQGEMPEINIPINISLDDEQVLGRIELKKNIWRNNDWKNEMPFPVKLKYIHAIILNKNKNGATVPFIYSWDLGDKEVPVLATVKIKSASIPKIVDNKARRIWIEYSVPPCIACKDKIINELTGGTTAAREQKIEVVSYVNERTNAYVVEVKVRSKYADTKGQNIIEMPALKVLEDGETYFIGPLYLPEGEKLEYEYRIKFVTDEEVLQSKWIYSSESSLYLNKKLVEDALGKFPGE